MNREDLLAIARKAALSAYAPYSHFRVGAALIVETAEGPRVVTGVNVENASFGLSLCAERNALAAACTSYSNDSLAYDQERTPPFISHVAVACIDAAPNDSPSLRSPCGACRQWLAELAPDAVCYIDGIDKDFRIDELLPFAFRLDT